MTASIKNRSLLEIFGIFLKLGCICFGGPIAHLGFFHREFVQTRRWLDEKTYMDLAALCQTLPGPASSQIAISIGMKEGGLIGGILAIIGFSLPSIILLSLAAYGLNIYVHLMDGAWLHGIKIAIAAVIAQAIMMMSKRFCTDYKRVAITGIASVTALYFDQFWIQIAIIFFGAIMGSLFLRSSVIITNEKSFSGINLNYRDSVAAWVVFSVLLVLFPTINYFFHNTYLFLFNIFYRTGALVFGGGHIVLPLLQSQIVDTGLLSNDSFLAGYGLAQAIPGPLFTFASYIGVGINPNNFGWATGLLCLLAIYLPSFLILIGVLPFWERYRHHWVFQSVLAGINASVIGLLVAAFYNPVWKSAISTPFDFIIALSAFIFLQWLRLSQWLVVLCCTLIYIAI